MTIKGLAVLAAVMFIFTGCLKGEEANDALKNDTTPAAEKFAKGADVSMLNQLEENGVKFYDEYNNEKECMTILKDYGINWIRIRTWVNPVDSNGSPLGGGNNDKAATLKLAVRAKKLGMKVLLDFHYSDFWADPSKQNKPAGWSALSGKALEDKVYEYTADILSSLKTVDALPDMVQVGNEVNGGMIWADGKTWQQGSESIGGYDGFAGLLKAGIKAVKECDSKIKIMIHLADGGDNELYRRVFDELASRNVDYDVIGFSFYPYWHGSFENLQGNLNDISARYGKDVMVAELSYAYTLNDGDGHGNSFGAAEELAGGYRATVKGQENVIKKVMNIVANVPDNRGKGFFYWEPDWIPKDGCGWKSGEGNGWENQAMFDFNGKALTSLNVFKTDPKESLPAAEITSIKDTEVTAYIGEMPTMPEETYVFGKDDSITKRSVLWDAVSADSLKSAGTFIVDGAVSGTNIKAHAVVTVSGIKNYISDPGLESGTLNSWTIEGTSGSISIESNKGNVYSGEKCLSYWNNADYTFDVSQSFIGIPNGIYVLKVWASGGGGEKSMRLYADNGTDEVTAQITNTGWNKWKQYEITAINVTEGKIKVGVKTDAWSGNWGKLDDFELTRIN